AANRLYVSDLNSHRVVVYADPRNSAATSVPIYGGTLANNDCDSTPDPAGIAASATSLHCPLGLAVDADGNLYVADFDNNRVLAFAAPPPVDTPTPPKTATNTPTATATDAEPADVTLAVDLSADRKSISPLIYGLNFAKESFAKEIALPLRRWGGNATTRYNWQTGNMNHASDWFFHNNVNYDPYTGAAQTADQWVAENKRTGAESLITLPMIGYVAKDGNQSTCGFKVSQYGAQDAVDTKSGFPDCGNGLHNGQPIISNPLDTSVAVDQNFSAGWVTQLKDNAATNGAVRFYALDNEPDIWFETHRDVSPTGWKYDEFRDTSIRYAAAVKAADPAAQLFGPAVNGWTYYWHGAYDGQREDWDSPDDRNAHGGTPFLEWYLQQLAAYETNNGVRLLDYLDVHFYPQNGVDQSLAGDAAKQALRLRSIRALWDPTYVDESWIAQAGPDGGIVKLIPRLHAWVDANYPGTKVALTEYNWGGLEDINGALAQAEILGIFGREGLDAAALWNYPARENNAGEEIKYDIFETLPGAYAFRLYRNYNGQGSQFGDTSVRATSSAGDKLAIFAAQRSADSTVTLVIINKTGGDLSANLDIAGLPGSGLLAASAAHIYRYSSADLNTIQALADLPLAGGNLHTEFPANSITLLDIPVDPNAPTATPTATPSTTPSATPSATPVGGGDEEELYLPFVLR
ncbi:MAG TPA: glycoside hydrolase family 44 protein, partial [Caldilineaceae bacterium]|nr:glycoside hydrolase family 44 protein [Caldilineaceae bacterium]